MSKAKFTKGPWEILPAEDDKEYLRIRGTVPGGRYKIVNVIDLEIYRGESEWCKLEHEESVANAHLIACAPDMHEILEDLSVEAKSYQERSGKTVTWISEVESLLKRARGE